MENAVPRPEQGNDVILSYLHNEGDCENGVKFRPIIVVVCRILVDGLSAQLVSHRYASLERLKSDGNRH